MIELRSDKELNRAAALLALVSLIAACSSGTGPATEADLAGGDQSISAPNDLAGADLAGSFDTDASGFDLATTPGNTITGTLLDGEGAPLAAFQVAIAGKTAVTNTQGVFSIANVTTPYTLIAGGAEPAASAYPGATHVIEYVGLTRLDPVITFSTLTADRTTMRSAMLSRNVTAPAGTDAGLLSFFSTANHLPYDELFTYTYPTAIPSKSFGWRGGATLVHTFLVLITGFYNPALSYYATVDFTTTDGQTQAVPDFALQPLTYLSVTEDFTPLAGGTYPYVAFDLVLANKRWLQWSGYSMPPAGPWKHREPNIPGALSARKYSSDVSSMQSAALWRGAPGSSAGAIVLRTPSSDVAPVGAPSNVARTASFSLTTGTVGAVRAMTFSDAASHADWSVVYTGATTGFPDGSVVGISAPAAGVTLARRLVELEDPGVDQTATPTGFHRIEFSGPAQAAYYYASGSLSSFAFAP